jgi:rubrerythrin
MKIFNVGDVLRFAVRIEEDGEAFYRKAALAAGDKSVSDLFSSLADEEIKHKGIFQDMLSKVETVAAAETYDGEYAAYLQNYIDDKVIFTKDKGEAASSEAKDTLSAILFAMQREADSILYYHESKQFIAEKFYGTIDKIIAEERKHFTRLSVLRHKYV